MSPDTTLDLIRTDPAQAYGLTLSAALALIMPLPPLSRVGLLQRLMWVRASRMNQAQWAGFDANSTMLAHALMVLESFECLPAPAKTSRDLGMIKRPF